jgi:hypothetical protein
MDCTHWCVAGVLDAWNELLCTAIISWKKKLQILVAHIL